MKNQIFIPNIFQAEALIAIDRAIQEKEKAFLIVMPTATGKTYLAAQWFRSQLTKKPKARLLYICHNQDILSQANDKEFENCLSEFDIPRGYYNRHEKNLGQVTFATVQTLRKNLKKLPHDYFDYIVVDEAHHYRAESFEKVIRHFSPKVLMGLTATPYRMDGKSILDIFNKTIYSAKISAGIKYGLLSKIKYYFVDNDIDFSDIKINSNGKYNEKDLNKKLCIKEFDDAIIKEYLDTIKQKYNKKKTICFCATVRHAYRMEKLFNDNGIKTVTLTGKHFTEKGKEASVHINKRKKIIEKFKNGDYDLIFVRDLFNEGIDVPDADCIMMLRPTESSRIFTQQIGRGLRISKDKNYLLVLDFTGNCFRCNINYEVLNEMIGIDIEKETKDRIRYKYDISEVIIQNIGCEVRLNKTRIDIIKDTKEEDIIKKGLIENYYNVKNKLNKIPTISEMNKNGKFEISIYIKMFGSWKKFLEAIEEKIKITEQKLIKNYWNLKNKYPHLTSIMINKRYGSKFDLTAYYKMFGSWKKFLDIIGEKVIRGKKINKDDLIKNYYDLKNKYPHLNSTMINKKNGSQFEIWTYIKVFGSWKKFLEAIGEKIIRCKKTINIDDLINNYYDLKNKYPHLNSTMINKKNGSQFNISDYYKIFGNWKWFLKIVEEYKKGQNKNNIILIPDYIPKNPLPDLNLKKSSKKHSFNYNSKGYKYKGGINKDENRIKIIEKIQDGDTILLLESPELSALKEIEMQGKNPKKIIIPNHFEFDELAIALKQYDTKLNIEAINTSALQFLIDHPEEYFNFIWLDYYGAFTYYIRDLDIIFQRPIRDLKLILTYNVFDPNKKDESYYFTNVINYVLKKLRGKNDILLMEDVSHRYKKLMFSIGFDIKIK